VTARVVLMNDTSTRYHHGCSRVMRCLSEGLTARGMTVSYRLPARADWRRDPAFLAAAAEAQLVVVNGEGTLHDGAAGGERLLSFAQHAGFGGKLALVNALYDRNPETWGHWLERFDLVCARDSASAGELGRVLGRAVDWVPDLSLSQADAPSTLPRSGVIVGDSVKAGQRRALAAAFRRFPEAVFVPTKTLRHPLLQTRTAARLIYPVYMGDWRLSAPRVEMPVTEAAYLARLSSARLHITGRFHAVCLSLLTGTPFLALASTSGKIEKLLTDLGLGTGRMITAEAVSGLSQDLDTYAFTAAETASIDTALTAARSQAEGLFDRLAALAGAG
jgi:hypothetical protein